MLYLRLFQEGREKKDSPIVATDMPQRQGVIIGLVTNHPNLILPTQSFLL